MLRLFTAALVAAFFVPVAAIAADTTVTIPYGGDVIAVARFLAELVVQLLPVALPALLAFVPAPLRLVLGSSYGEKLVRNAVDFALNAVEGAAKGKQLQVDVGYDVLATAVEYALQEGKPWLVKYLGGPDGIRKKVFRSLDLDETASALALGA